MAYPKLEVITGSLPRRASGKTAKVRAPMSKRWRLDGVVPSTPAAQPEERDVIPLLDGWIRRLEREAGEDQPQTR